MPNFSFSQEKEPALFSAKDLCVYNVSRVGVIYGSLRHPSLVTQRNILAPLPPRYVTKLSLNGFRKRIKMVIFGLNLSQMTHLTMHSNMPT